MIGGGGEFGEPPFGKEAEIVTRPDLGPIAAFDSCGTHKKKRFLPVRPELNAQELSLQPFLTHNPRPGRPRGSGWHFPPPF